MLSEPMNLPQVVSLRLNLGNALASSSENQYIWGQLTWILSKLENLLSANPHTTMAIHIIWLQKTAITSVRIYLTS